MELLQRSAGTSEELGWKTDLVELLLIRGEADDFKAAATSLEVVRRQLSTGQEEAASIPFQPGEKMQRQGIACVLSALLSILTQDGKERQNLAAWQQWLSEGRDPTGRSRQLTGWEWATWDKSFPADKYSREQNMKIRAIQLSAGTASDSQNNLTCEQMTLWFDGAEPCPHRFRDDASFSPATR
jgi:hypothetical protein